MKTARFEVYQDKGNEWRWSLIGANGRRVAQGESHTRKADAERALERLSDLSIQALVRHLRGKGKLA